MGIIFTNTSNIDLQKGGREIIATMQTCCRLLMIKTMAVGCNTCLRRFDCVITSANRADIGNLAHAVFYTVQYADYFLYDPTKTRHVRDCANRAQTVLRQWNDASCVKGLM